MFALCFSLIVHLSVYLVCTTTNCGLVSKSQAEQTSVCMELRNYINAILGFNCHTNKTGHKITCLPLILINETISFTGEVPWEGHCAETIKAAFSKGQGLKLTCYEVPEYFKIIMEHGLQKEPTNRQLSFLQVRDMLVAAPKVCF